MNKEINLHLNEINYILTSACDKQENKLSSDRRGVKFRRSLFFFRLPVGQLLQFQFTFLDNFFSCLQ